MFKDIHEQRRRHGERQDESSYKTVKPRMEGRPQELLLRQGGEVGEVELSVFCGHLQYGHGENGAQIGDVVGIKGSK